MTANQDEISDHETFQLEYDPSTGRWYMRTMQDKYFTLGAGGGIQASENKRCDAEKKRFFENSNIFWPFRLREIEAR